MFSMFIPNLEPDLSTYQPTSRCDRCRLAKNPLNLPEVFVVAKKETLEVRKYDGFAEARNTARSVPRTRRRIMYFCLSFFAAWIWEVPGNREQPKLPVHTLRKTNITMEKDPLKMYFLLNMGIFHLYVSLPEGIQRIVREE